jgi:hypothetical protein
MAKAKKRLLLVLLAATAFGLAGYVVLDYAMTPEAGVTWANFHRLRQGMSVRQVQAILGRPPDLAFSEAGEVATLPRGCPGSLVWYGDDVSISIRVADDGTAEGGGATQAGPNMPFWPQELRPRESVLDTLRRLLHL